jgi:hypothetical protein
MRQRSPSPVTHYIRQRSNGGGASADGGWPEPLDGIGTMANGITVVEVGVGTIGDGITDVVVAVAVTMCIKEHNQYKVLLI